MSKTPLPPKENIHNKSKDYENSVNRYASWAYQETFLVLLFNYLGFTVQLKKCKEGNTHRFARIQSIYYEVDNSDLKNAIQQEHNDSSDDHLSTTTDIDQKSQINKNAMQMDEIQNLPNGTTKFLLFEDTEYFEGLCSQQSKRSCSKNINDFAKVCSIFMMYFFNTFGIEFDIKGEAKTFPIITSIRFQQSTINNAVIQEVGRKYFSVMMKGNQLSTEAILLNYKDEQDKQVYEQLMDFFCRVQQGVYSSQTDYICFIKFITEKFYNLYCNNDRTVAYNDEENEEKYSVKGKKATVSPKMEIEV